VLERRWRGTVIREKRGSNGFGYDPVFVPGGLEVTSAELDPAEKDARSHRGQAFEALVPLIAAALGPR
jgi:XTP/dITP diphosphohydrolase